jgi:hypothetical protein
MIHQQLGHDAKTLLNQELFHQRQFLFHMGYNPLLQLFQDEHSYFLPPPGVKKNLG